MGGLYASWRVRRHTVGYFKIIKLCRASVAQGVDPGFPAAMLFPRKNVDVKEFKYFVRV